MSAATDDCSAGADIQSQVGIGHRDNGGGVKLNEVSTGQRATYVLSVFLAMNA